MAGVAQGDGSRGLTKTHQSPAPPWSEGPQSPLEPPLPPRFPSEHFGKLFGLVMALSAVVSLLQFPLFTLIKGPLQDDPLYVSTGGWGPWP